MPDRRQLRPGDRIRLVAVPQCDIEQRTREQQDGRDDAGYTANVIDRIIARDPIVEIAYVDEYGAPWFERQLSDGQTVWHSIMILDDESWEQM